ncbi:TadE/TadG family type IV pilus assembly protein [Phenylobacterium sp.]|jgi:Flp pilus assembly pilin Flp|uniref:TadE/TadG family type IV pilus assembly protein n=1 Tax=Phenylobacterium sp. TaxID=1871053 RepID=UPI002F937B98
MIQAVLIRFARDRRGVAAVEMSLIASLLCVCTVNAVEVARYASSARQVSAATHAAAQAAFATCDPVHTPATTKCPELATTTGAAVASTPLGAAVKLSPLTEGYYCVSTAGKLTYVSAADSPPADCSSVSQSGIRPGLYLRVQTTYTHAKLLGVPTVADTFANPIQRSAWMRMK